MEHTFRNFGVIYRILTEILGQSLRGGVCKLVVVLECRRFC
jgi:hypothetical protein